MTTVAYRNGKIAADTGVTFGGSRTTGVRKIAQNDQGDLCGVGGTAGFGEAFLRWFGGGEDGQHPVPQEKSDGGHDKAIVIRAADPNTIEVYEPAGNFPLRNTCFAFGSGAPEANGAMFMGADAVTAIAAAKAFDNNTHGEVMSFAFGAP